MLAWFDGFKDAFVFGLTMLLGLVGNNILTRHDMGCYIFSGTLSWCYLSPIGAWALYTEPHRVFVGRRK